MKATQKIENEANPSQETVKFGPEGGFMIAVTVPGVNLAASTKKIFNIGIASIRENIFNSSYEILFSDFL